jgi:hypothetical protein
MEIGNAVSAKPRPHAYFDVELISIVGQRAERMMQGLQTLE